MDPPPPCPICGSPMWLVVDEGSADGAASHFECFFHFPDRPDNTSTVSLRNAYGRTRSAWEERVKAEVVEVEALP